MTVAFEDDPCVASTFAELLSTEFCFVFGPLTHPNPDGELVIGFRSLAAP